MTSGSCSMSALWRSGASLCPGSESRHACSSPARRIPVSPSTTRNTSSETAVSSALAPTNGPLAVDGALDRDQRGNEHDRARTHSPGAERRPDDDGEDEVGARPVQPERARGDDGRHADGNGDQRQPLRQPRLARREALDPRAHERPDDDDAREVREHEHGPRLCRAAHRAGGAVGGEAEQRCHELEAAVAAPVRMSVSPRCSRVRRTPATCITR